MKSEINDNTLFDIATSLLAENHSLSYKLRGNSMFPVLREGDVAEVIACEADYLKKGDIVVFKTESGLVAHRIIKIQKQNNALKFITRGDNSRQNDSPFGKEQLLGKIQFFFRNGQKHQINRLTTFYRKSNSTFIHTMMLVVNKIMFRSSYDEVLGSLQSTLTPKASVPLQSYWVQQRDFYLIGLSSNPNEISPSMLFTNLNTVNNPFATDQNKGLIGSEENVLK